MTVALVVLNVAYNTAAVRAVWLGSVGSVCAVL